MTPRGALAMAAYPLEVGTAALHLTVVGVYFVAVVAAVVVVVPVLALMLLASAVHDRLTGPPGGRHYSDVERLS